METQEFLIHENYMLRREIEKQANKIRVYESIIFDMLDIDFKFEMVDDVSEDPQIMVYITIPFKEITIVETLESVKELMLVSLK